MISHLLPSALLFALLPVAVSGTAPVSTLSRQCWHEYPLSTILLQDSQDGESELVTKIGHATTASSNRPYEAPGVTPDYGPWSYQPLCTEFLESVGSQLCVFTNTSFSHGRGISIFTTPRLAEEFAALPPFRDPDALDGINAPCDNWYTQDVPGKGVGMLAKKQLKFKDRVTAYTPALLAYVEGELSTMDREKFFRIAVSQLPEATIEKFLQLSYIYGQPQIRIQDIVKANTFQLEVSGQNYLAVFPETSRLNHACAPNAQYYLDPSLLAHFVHVTRPVAQGEEITISYISPLEPTEERQRHLHEGFHFVCTCPRCSAKGATDAKLAEIQDMQRSLNDWSDTSTGTPKLAEKLMQLYRKEGLEGFLDIPYGFAALAYNAVGDTKKAAKYAEQAKELILMKDGPWTPNLQIWEELLKDPKRHWSYKRRQP